MVYRVVRRKVSFETTFVLADNQNQAINIQMNTDTVHGTEIVVNELLSVEVAAPPLGIFPIHK